MGVGSGLYMCDVVVKKFTFAVSSPDEFLLNFGAPVVSSETGEAIRTLSLENDWAR